MNKLIMDYVDPEMKESTLSEAEADHFRDAQLTMSAYENAVVYPGVDGVGGGVVDSNGVYIKYTSVYAGNQEGAYEAEICENESDVVYLGMFFSCWGHCLTDCLQHLWFLNTAKSSTKNFKLVYTTTNWDRKLGDNFKQLLMLLGLDIGNAENITKPTRFRRVVVPDSCFYNDVAIGRLVYTHEYSTMIALLIKSICGENTMAPYRRVFFTRTGVSDYRDFTNGGKVLEDVFREMGYEIVRPETLSFVELVKLLQQTKEFASPDGSCAHNALFLQQGSRDIVIRRANYINKYQPLIDQLRGLESVVIDAHRSNLLFNKRQPMCGPFFVYVNERLASFAGIKSKFPLAHYVWHVCWFWYKKARGVARQLLKQ